MLRHLSLVISEVEGCSGNLEWITRMVPPLGATSAVATPTVWAASQRREIPSPLAKIAFYGNFYNCMIEVRHLSGDQYEVRVTDETATTHQVTLKEADRVRLGGADISGDELIAESFRFLLEREPNTSILRKFDLSVIGTYFPEYEQDIRKRVAQR